MLKKTRTVNWQSNFLHFTHGPVLIVISITQKTLCLGTIAFVDDMTNQTITRWSYHIPAENIVIVKSMMDALMVDAGCCVILVAALLAVLKFLFLVIVAKNSKESHVKLHHAQNLLAKTNAVSFLIA